MTTPEPTPSAPCPKCGANDPRKVGYTWWGGALGPKMFNHVRCGACGATYNSKTGRSNLVPILIYNVVILVVCLALYLIIQGI